MSTVVWFRNDLRVDDNPALGAACAQGEPVIPVYVLDATSKDPWREGAASRWWLARSLKSLAASFEALHSRLIILKGDPAEAIVKLAAQVKASGVYWNRRYEPGWVSRDAAVEADLAAQGIQAASFDGNLLYDPHAIRTKSDRPYQVFTAYWNACLAHSEPDLPEPGPDAVTHPKRWPKGLSLDDAAKALKVKWRPRDEGMWSPGTKGARVLLDAFLRGGIETYVSDRDIPGVPGTSRLSPHLHFGEISPREVWHEAREYAMHRSTVSEEPFLRQLVWREFAHHLLVHFPETPERPLREQFAAFPWADDPEGLAAWREGRTGYPLVDAGMRELAATGWMHNRVRMVVATLLTKHLLTPWQEGARFFWDTLVDADLANNTLGWQWTAGCGADAAPYFRILNPVRQGERFDRRGDYVREWVPELMELPDKWIHHPWDAPKEILERAGVTLGNDYPEPIVDLKEGRERALAAYEHVKQARKK